MSEPAALPAADAPAAAAPVAPDKRAAEIEEAWGYYRIWAMTSRMLKGKNELFRSWTVRATFIAVLAGPLAQYIGLFGFRENVAATITSLVSWVSAIAVTAVAFFNEKILGPERDKPWLNARAVAEKIKGETYRYIMRAAPYETPGENALSEKVHEVQDTLHGIPPVEITAEEKKNRLPPAELTGDDYLTQRIVDQIDYFRARRDENQQIVERYKKLGWLFGGISALLVLPVPAAIEFFKSVGFQNAVALSASVASGVSGFLIANMSASRYKFLAESYEVARGDLDSLRSTWRTSVHTPEKLADLVTRAEDILAKENAAWYEELARLQS